MRLRSSPSSSATRCTRSATSSDDDNFDLISNISILLSSLLKDTLQQHFLLQLVQLQSTHCRRSRSRTPQVPHWLLQKQLQTRHQVVPRSVVFMLLLRPKVIHVSTVGCYCFPYCFVRERSKLFDSYDSQILNVGSFTDLLSYSRRAFIS